MYTADFTDTLRAGTMALKAALDAVGSKSMRHVLVVVGPMRVRLSPGRRMNKFSVMARRRLSFPALAWQRRCSASSPVQDEITDVWRTDNDPFPQQWEARFIINRLPDLQARLGGRRVAGRYAGGNGHLCWPTSVVTLTKDVKQEIFDRHGSTKWTLVPRRCRSRFTRRIDELTEHLRTHRKDHHSRRGLLKLVGQRRRLLNYLQKRDLEGYRALIKEPSAFGGRRNQLPI